MTMRYVVDIMYRSVFSSSFTYIEYFALDASVNACQIKNFIMQTVDIKYIHSHA